MSSPAPPSVPASAESPVPDFATLEDFAQVKLQEQRPSELVEGLPTIVQRSGIYLVAAGLVVSACLMFVKVHAVVVAKGKVVPQGEGIPVQALDGGVVAEVLAHPGDRLAAGAPILRLEGSRSGLSLAALQRKVKIEEQSLAGLEADARVLERVLQAPEKRLDETPPAVVTGEAFRVLSEAHAARRELIEARIARERHAREKRPQLEERVALGSRSLALMEKVRADLEAAVARAATELAEYRELAAKGFFSAQDRDAEEERFRQLQRRLDQAALDIANERLRVSQLALDGGAEQDNADKRLGLASTRFRTSLGVLAQALGAIRGQVETLQASLANARDELGLQERQVASSRSSTRMPVAGTITEMPVTSPGQLVSAGATVAVVMPEGVPLLVRASVASKDVGFVREGQPARVKVDAFPFQQFGTLPGEVAKVFPNSGQSQDFTVLIALRETSLSAGDARVHLFPGLTAQAELLTRKQPLYRLLLGGGRSQAAEPAPRSPAP